MSTRKSKKKDTFLAIKKDIYAHENHLKHKTKEIES